jgi:type IV pilus assembly protein PilP
VKKAALRIWVGVFALSTAAALASGCGDDGQQKNVKPAQFPPPAPPAAPGAPGTPGPPGATAGGRGAADAGADGASGNAENLPPLPVREFQESDFAESDRSRDPFRSFEGVFAAQAKGRVQVQRQVLVDRYALDELKLVGVVTRGAPRALFTDPTGFGWVAKVGDFIGKAEIVQAGAAAGMDVAINWRVDRIRESDVVFVREDPSHPEIPPTTRVIALYPIEDEAARGAPRRR